MLDSNLIISILNLALLIGSPLIDILNYLNLTNIQLKNKKYTAEIIGVLLVTMVLEIISLYTSPSYSDPIFTLVETTLLYLFSLRKINNLKLAFNACLIINILDLSLNIIENILEQSIFVSIDPSLIYLVLITGGYLIIRHYAPVINHVLSGQSQSVILYTLFYLYFSSVVAYIIAYMEKRISVTTIILLGILLIQGVFAITSLNLSIKTQQDLLEKSEQKRLRVINMQLQENNKQLKDYANSLEKDEDKLRRFKHDYRNILNSLKIAAQNNDSKQLVEKLDKYSQEHFDESTLSKFRDANHIHDEMVKSIIITKIAKIYDKKIPYSFSCEQDITEIPFISNEERLDVIRIIGISFDNAIQASEKTRNARIEAMLYQDHGNLEFVIRNRVDIDIATNKLEKAGYTTKTDHEGLGLNNVVKITDKYFANMMVDINSSQGWFTFSLVLLPKSV